MITERKQTLMDAAAFLLIFSNPPRIFRDLGIEGWFIVAFPRVFIFLCCVVFSIVSVPVSLNVNADEFEAAIHNDAF